jgi:hypothetical protein
VPAGQTAGYGFQQLAGVILAWAAEDLVAGPVLFDPSVAQHDDLTRDGCDDGEVVRDEDVADAEFALQIAEQVEGLCLNRNVKCGDGLIQEQQIGFQRKGTGDGDALALAAGQLPRQPIERQLRQPHQIDRQAGAGLELPAIYVAE